MIICEACYIRIRRTNHPVHINITQSPIKHHFCSMDCKLLWVSYVRETKKIPPTFIEVVSKEGRFVIKEVIP